MIAIVVITHNRVHLLRKCVENVLARTSDATREIVVWNNGSTDATARYLSTLSDPRIRVVDHPYNIGQNAYAEGIALTREPYLIELDDDVTDAPKHWDATLLNAFRRLPSVGFLASNLVDDPNDLASRLMHHDRRGDYLTTVENGIHLLKGPTGGGCAMTTRDLCDRVGGFPRKPGEVFWQEEPAYLAMIQPLGYEAAILEDLRVHHTGGAYYAHQSAEKDRFWGDYHRRLRRKSALKQALLHVPFVARLNRRHRWFEPETAPQVRRA